MGVEQRIVGRVTLKSAVIAVWISDANSCRRLEYEALGTTPEPAHHDAVVVSDSDEEPEPKRRRCGPSPDEDTSTAKFEVGAGETPGPKPRADGISPNPIIEAKFGSKSKC